MIEFLIIGFIAIIGVMALLIVRERDRLSSTIRSTLRTPRDIGALILVERFGKGDLTRQEHGAAILPKASRERSGLHARKAHSPYPVASHKDEFTAVEGVAYGAQLGYEPIQNLMKIDEHVYTAMGILSGEQLDSIGDLSQSLSSWESAEPGQSLPEGAVNKLMGHLAEPIVAQNLESLGMEIEMPDLSNQEGYDLILDGEYFANVKTVADASSIASHFDKYPQIPVIVPEDMEGIPEDAIFLNTAESIDQLKETVELGEEGLVFVDPLLSKEEMTEYAEDVSDGLLGNIDPVGIPVITLALSGFRELRLLRNQRTNMGNAAKNWVSC